MFPLMVMPTGKRSRRAVAAAGAIGVAVTAVWWVVGSYKYTIPTPDAVIRLDLLATRDLGALPARDSWCAGASHCWLFQQSSGDATDYGDVGGWHLSPHGAVRAGIVSSLPVRGPTVDLISELASWADGAGIYFEKAAVTQDSSTVASVTYVYYASPASGTQNILYHLGGSHGIRVAYSGSSTYGWVYGISATKQAIWPGPDVGAWNCETMVLDARSAQAARLFRNGAQVTASASDLSGAGDFRGTSSTRLVGSGSFGLARMAEGIQQAWTLTTHRAQCGDLWGAPSGGLADNKPVTSDDTWTQTGSPSCWPTGSTTAVCVPGGFVPYAVVLSAPVWAVERSSVQRIPYATDINCTNWTCTGAAISAAVAPDGSPTAAAITMGGGTVDATATGYANSTALHLRLWAKCSSGTLDASNVGGAGHWTVNCTTVGGNWALLHSTHEAVTEVQAWQSSGTGVVVLRLSGADATIWAPTLTEEEGVKLSVIPNATSGAVSTGDPVWAIDNTGGKYYRSGDTVTSVLTQVSGTCLAVSGNNLLLSGATTCNGLWGSLEVRR